MTWEIYFLLLHARLGTCQPNSANVFLIAINIYIVNNTWINGSIISGRVQQIYLFLAIKYQHYRNTYKPWNQLDMRVAFMKKN